MKRIGLSIGLLCCWGALHAQAPALYLCPGRLLTNKIDAAQAKRQGCVVAAAAPRDRAVPAQDAENAPSPSRRITPAPGATADTGSTARDAQARLILQAELEKTQAEMQSLSGQAADNPAAQSRLQRLRADEAALRRELARRPG